MNNCRYKIKELDSLVSASQPVAEKTAEKPAAKETKAKEAPKPEPPKEEEEDGGMGGLFD